MRIIHRLDEMTETARGWAAVGTVGFVPTMGFLHEGHMSLVEAARRECEISAASIFVNPLQFATGAEFAAYPRDTVRDLQLLDSAGVDVVFLPDKEEMFPANFSAYVIPSGPVAERLEAAAAPQYMRGVATVLVKLFQLVRPDIAYFGQKDAQQVALVRQIVRDLNMDIRVHVLPTLRERDGLALSNHNRVLSPVERQTAPAIYQALLAGKTLIDKGEMRAARIEQAMRRHLAHAPEINVDYIDICHPATFRPLKRAAPGTLLVIAARIGSARLVDNIVWTEDDNWVL